MLQTVKIARLCAGMDPDRSESSHGTLYANNMPGWRRTYTREIRVTRGAFRARKHGA